MTPCGSAHSAPAQNNARMGMTHVTNDFIVMMTKRKRLLPTRWNPRGVCLAYERLNRAVLLQQLKSGFPAAIQSGSSGVGIVSDQCGSTTVFVGHRSDARGRVAF